MRAAAACWSPRPASLPRVPTPSELGASRFGLRRRLSGRGRQVIIVIAALVLLLIISSRAISGFYVDYLWYDSLGRSDMFWGMLRPKLLLFAIFALVFILVAALNLAIADRLAPTAFSANMHPVVERFHEFFGHRLRAARFAVAVVLGLLVAIPAAGQWQQWLMFTNSKGFGISDPQFGNDVGFYLFKMPFLTFVISWLFLAVLLITLLVVATHVLSGGIIFTPPRPRVRAATKAHVAVLLTILALLKAADYWVSRYDTTTDTRGIVRGALYSVVHAELPALTLLALIAVMVAGLYMSTLRTGSWRLPLVASGLWAVMAVVGGFIAPSVVQSLLVNPNQKDREAPFIARNVEATRHALGIDTVESRTISIGALTKDKLTADTAPLSDVRMLNPAIVRGRFNADEGITTGLAVNDLDPDRYEVDGRIQQVMIGARELDLKSIGNTSWQGEHLISTHGCGVVIAPANRVDTNGRPAYIHPDLTRPELYISDSLTGYAIVNTDVAEQSCGGTAARDRYAGVAGVQLSNGFRRLAFALSYLDYNLFGSSAITDQSRVISVRRVQDRVRKVAPFLSFDNDPYPVVLNGRVLWVVDGYSTSNRYPYSQGADRSQLAADSGLNHAFNYVRNSVKAVVDAYDGTVSLFVVDDNDPVVKVWESAFPDLFRPKAELPVGLAQHLRYPEELFRIQTAAYSKYHLSADEFLERNKAWSVAPAPAGSPENRVLAGAPEAGSDAEAEVGGVGLARDNAAERFEPYYTMFREPGAPPSTPTSFSMFRPFTPFSPDDRRPELRAFMTVGSDPWNYGKLVSYDIAQADRPDGPVTVEASIESDDVVSRNLTQWNQEGSRVSFGDMQMIPIGDAILWVRPLYLQPKSAPQPSFRQVIVSAGGRVQMANSLGEALGQLFPGFSQNIGDVVGGGPVTSAPPTGTGTATGTPGTGTTSGTGTPNSEPGTGADETPAALLAAAERAFADADTALAAGDLGTYQTKIDEAKELVKRAAAAMGGSAG